MGDAALSASAVADIARKLLLQSPPGELPAVADGLRVVLGDAAVDAVAASAFREHNAAQMLAADLPGGEGKVLITADAELEGGGGACYLEPRSGQAVTFDHVRQVCTAARPATAAERAPDAAEPYRAAAERALAAYVRESYAPHGAAAVYGGVDASTGALRLVLCVAAAAFNPKNFWTGRVRCRWVATLRPADADGDGDAAAEAALSGTLRADVHYFEEGNVQLATAHEATATAALPGGGRDAEAAGAAVVAALRAAERDYFAGLEGGFEALAGRTFKELRRALPVTRAKFAWEQAAHKLAMELAAKERAAAAAAK